VRPAGEATVRILLALLALAAMLSVAASQIVLGLLLAWLLWRWRAGRPPPRTGLEWPALALVVWALALIPWSEDRAQSLLYARRWYLLAPVWIGAAFGTVRGARLGALAALAAGAAASAAHGIWQVVRKGGARFEEGGQLVGRADPLAGYMTGGGLLMLAALVLLAALLTIGVRRRRSWLGVALGAALAVALLCLVLTLTRSAWLGFLAGAAVIFALARPRWLPALGAAAVAGALLLPGTLQSRLLSAFAPDDPGNVQRVEMWRTGWQWILDEPVTGRGDRDLKNAYREHHADRPDVEIQGHLHSNPIMFAVLWGLPGLVLALGLLLTALRSLWRRWRELRAAAGRAPPDAEGDLDRAWCVGALGAWTGMNVAGLFEWNFGDAEISLLLWLIVGLGLARPRPRD
jgi:O-antigen ligase